MRMCRSRKSSREIARLRMRYKNMEMKWNQIKDGDLSEVPKDKWLTVAYKNPIDGKTYVDFGLVCIEKAPEYPEYVELFMLDGFATGDCLIAWVENPEPYIPFAVGIIIKLPIGLAFRIALMFVACSVFVLLGVRGKM